MSAAVFPWTLATAGGVLLGALLGAGVACVSLASYVRHARELLRRARERK